MPLPMPERVPATGFYYHYKHDFAGSVNNYAYEVLGIGFHTEGDRRPGEAHFVIYIPLYESPEYKASNELSVPTFYNRPLEMWMEQVTKDGRTFPRFQKILDPETIAALEKIHDEMY